MPFGSIKKSLLLFCILTSTPSLFCMAFLDGSPNPIDDDMMIVNNMSTYTGT